MNGVVPITKFVAVIWLMKLSNIQGSTSLTCDLRAQDQQGGDFIWKVLILAKIIHSDL